MNLIFIASIGRSGSTLLESMLGAHSQIATIGELHIWPHEIISGGIRPCSCGVTVQRCQFWLEMQKRIDPLNLPSPRIDYFREQHNAGRTLRLSRYGDFGAKTVSDPKLLADIEQYASNNEKVFRAFSDLYESQSGLRPRWIVDASKDPYRLMWFIRSRRFNLKVIHLVRDPKAFVYSVTKQYLPDGDKASRTRQLYFTARQAVAWSIQNRLVYLAGRNHLDGDSYKLIRYEDLAVHPHDTFRQVCDFIGCKYEGAAVDGFRRGSEHTIAGNPMRYESKGISLDQRWETALPAPSRRIAQLIAGPSMSRYGYP